MEKCKIVQRILEIIPKLTSNKHKGQNGRIGVIGGSPNYTGAPYYSAISALYGGADLSHIYCHEKASIPIKSYSPEIIVHPILLNGENEGQGKQEMLRYLEQQSKVLNGIAIGPGLGRDQFIIQNLQSVITIFDKIIKVLDADSLWILANTDILSQIKQDFLILTPNKYEFGLLWNKYMVGIDRKGGQQDLEFKDPNYGEIDITHPMVQDQVSFAAKYNIYLFMKGHVDIITNGKKAFYVNMQGSQKRCGGIGDIVAGLTSLYSHWGQTCPSSSTSKDEQEYNIMTGMVLASIITKQASFSAFDEHYYSLTAPKVIEQIGRTFKNFHKSNLREQTDE